MTAVRLLLVEGEPDLLRLLGSRLEAEGFQVHLAANGAAGLEQFETQNPDLVLLSRALPQGDGLVVCRRIREQSRVPILILSERAEETDAVAAFELGADDYVVKPFRVNELLARIRALLRRAPRGRTDLATEPLGRRILSSGAISIDLSKREVRVRGAQVPLTPTEYRMLLELTRRGGEVVTREELLESVWGYDGYDAALVNTHVKRLRARIEADPGRPEIVLTVRGFGYRLAG